MLQLEMMVIRAARDDGGVAIPVRASAHPATAATQLWTSQCRKVGGKLGLPVWACKLCSTRGRVCTSRPGKPCTGSEALAAEVARGGRLCCCLKKATRLAGLALVTANTCKHSVPVKRAGTPAHTQVPVSCCTNVCKTT